MAFWQVVCMVFSLISILSATDIPGEESVSAGFRIEGKVEVLTSRDKDWLTNTRILVDGGDFLGFLKSDGSFSINGLPSGSYVLEITNPTYLFEPARVDINYKGKIRARKVNHLQPASLKTISYPLEFRERGKANYFQVREQWRITDFLFNPMVLTMILPLVIIMILPKMMNAADPDTQREVQTQMNALNAKQNLPDMSEFFTSLFSDGKKTSKSKSASKKR